MTFRGLRNNIVFWLSLYLSYGVIKEHSDLGLPLNIVLAIVASVFIVIIIALFTDRYMD